MLVELFVLPLNGHLEENLAQDHLKVDAWREEEEVVLIQSVDVVTNEVNRFTTQHKTMQSQQTHNTTQYNLASADSLHKTRQCSVSRFTTQHKKIQRQQTHYTIQDNVVSADSLHDTRQFSVNRLTTQHKTMQCQQIHYTTQDNVVSANSLHNTAEDNLTSAYSRHNIRQFNVERLTT